VGGNMVSGIGNYAESGSSKGGVGYGGVGGNATAARPGPGRRRRRSVWRQRRSAVVAAAPAMAARGMARRTSGDLRRQRWRRRRWRCRRRRHRRRYRCCLGQRWRQALAAAGAAGTGGTSTNGDPTNGSATEAPARLAVRVRPAPVAQAASPVRRPWCGHGRQWRRWQGQAVRYRWMRAPSICPTP
jgi:hypothetical protein